MSELTPEMLLRTYAAGIFPMGESGGPSALFWVDPEWRGILPLDRFRISGVDYDIHWLERFVGLKT